MRLTSAQVGQVQRGEKTEHRIPITAPHKVRRPPVQGKVGRANPRTGLSATYISETRKPKPGDSIVIAPRIEADIERNKPEVPEVRIQVTDVKRDTLQNLTTADAHAEGYKGRTALSDFMHDWMVRRDPDYPPTGEALCKECDGFAEYPDHDGEMVPCDRCDIGVVEVPIKPDPETIITRFERKHAHHPVYVVTFIHQADVSLWVHRRPGHPMTTSIGEALDPDAPYLGEPRQDWRDRGENARVEAIRDVRLAGLDRIQADYLAELERVAADLDSQQPEGHRRKHADQVAGVAHAMRQQHARARRRLTQDRDDDQDRRAA